MEKRSEGMTGEERNRGVGKHLREELTSKRLGY